MPCELYATFFGGNDRRRRCSRIKELTNDAPRLTDRFHRWLGVVIVGVNDRIPLQVVQASTDVLEPAWGSVGHFVCREVGRWCAVRRALRGHKGVPGKVRDEDSLGRSRRGLLSLRGRSEDPI